MIRSLHSVLAATALALLVGTSLALAAQAFEPQVWFGGEDPMAQKHRHTDYSTDFMNLFEPNSPWQVGASGVSVFKVSTQLILRGTDDEIRTVLQGLRARHIGLAIELGLLEWRGDCGGLRCHQH